MMVVYVTNPGIVWADNLSDGKTPAERAIDLIRLYLSQKSVVHLDTGWNSEYDNITASESASSNLSSMRTLPSGIVTRASKA